MKRLIVLLLALALLCGCGAQQAAPPAAPEQPAAEHAPEQAAPAGSFAMAFEEDAGWDPFSCSSIYNRLVLELVCEPLFTVAADGTILPVLATGWSVTDNGLVTTVTLRGDVRFHSGAQMTAADVVRSVKLAMAGTYYSGRFSQVSEVTALGSGAVRFITAKPYECFPMLLDIPIVGSAEENTEVDGTGAYMLRGGALRKNPRWHGEGETLPDVLDLTAVDSGETLRDAFQFGGVGVTGQDPNCDLPVYFGGDHEIWDVPTSTLQFLGFRMGDGLFANGGVRAAVTYAIDREAIVTEDMGGYGAATALLARPGTPWYSGALADTVSYDPARLRAALPAEASAVMIVCGDNPQRTASARRIAAALEACGLKVELRELSAAAFDKARAEGAYDLYYGEIRLSPDFDFAPLLLAIADGSFDTETILSLCDLTRANSGNAYDLQKAVLTDGLLCPIAYKTAALYGKRDLPIPITPHLNGWPF